MSQRSYSNDRNRKGAKIGSTRKSAAKAKPIRKQGSATVTREVSKPAGRRKERTPGTDWTGLPTSPEIQKWRRVWWVLLLGGLAALGAVYVIPEWRTNEQVLRVVTLVVLACSMIAVGIDFFVIRKLRNELIAKSAKKPSPKQAAREAADREVPAGKKVGASKKRDASTPPSDPKAAKTPAATSDPKDVS